jgi:hypothetical protein
MGYLVHVMKFPCFSNLPVVPTQKCLVNRKLELVLLMTSLLSIVMKNLQESECMFNLLKDTSLKVVVHLKEKR